MKEKKKEKIQVSYTIGTERIHFENVTGVTIEEGGVLIFKTDKGTTHWICSASNWHVCSTPVE
jgi:hypothetical protein